MTGSPHGAASQATPPPPAHAPLTRPRALIFDWDNTLIDSWATIHAALTTTFSRFGLTPWTLEQTRARVRQSLRDSFPAMFGADWPEARECYLESFRAIHLERLQVLPGAEALISWARQEAGLPLAIISNKTGSILRTEVDYLGWGEHFVAALGAGDAIYDKPHRAPVDMVLRHLDGTDTKDIWFIGDTDIDIECACNAGCAPVLIDSYANVSQDSASNAIRIYLDLISLRQDLEKTAAE